VVVLAPAVVSAAPLRAELAIERAQGAADCPDEGALEKLVARILNDRPAGAAGGEEPPASVKILIQFARTAAGYQATLRLRGAKEGERTLTDTGPTCTALGRAVSITIALLLDAQALDEQKPEPPAAQAVVAPPISPPPEAPPPPAVGGFLAFGGGPAIGLVGAISLAGALELDLRLGHHARFRIAGQYVAPRSTTVDAGSIDVSLLAARVGLCGASNDQGRLRVSVCAGGAAGRLLGSGNGFPASRASSLTWLAAGGGVQLTMPIAARWELSAGLEVLVPLRKYTFSLGTSSGGREVVYGSDRVSAMLQAGIGVKIW
jgi:hypothetical protein